MIHHESMIYFVPKYDISLLQIKDLRTVACFALKISIDILSMLSDIFSWKEQI